MNGTLSSNHIFLSFYLKNYFFSESGIKRATAGFADACMLVITKELPSFHQRGFNQANNEALHPHPLARRSTQAGMLRVKKLDYQSLSNHRTHKTPCRTTVHLEDIIGTANWEGGVFSEAADFEMEHQSFPK